MQGQLEVGSMIAYRFNAGTPRPAAVVPAVDTRSTHIQLLDWLTEAAGNGERCPYRSKVCERFDLLAESQADDLFKILEEQGYIGVYHAKNHRVVAIAATGQHTRATKTPAWNLWLRNWKQKVSRRAAE
jgi:hypothetical protein